jgi:RimJ/RimL family protein N-acetyltransferase
MDCKLLFEWAINEDSRENSLKPDPIRWEDHIVWFEGKLDNPFCKMFILEEGGHPIGQIRYDKTEKNWEIDFYIDKKFRGLGFGKRIVELSRAKVPGPIVAIVKEENISSCKVFEKLGFVRKKIENGLIQYKCH